MRIVLKLILNALAIIATAYLIPGIVVENFYVAIVVALMLGVLNIIVKPILIILTLPITILTLGLFTFVINGFLFWFLGTFVKGFSVDGFLAAILGALLISVISSIGGKIIDRE